MEFLTATGKLKKFVVVVVVVVVVVDN